MPEDEESVVGVGEGLGNGEIMPTQGPKDTQLGG